MAMRRLVLLSIFIAALAGILAGWYFAVGFDPRDPRWWAWLARAVRARGGMPDRLLMPMVWSGAIALPAMALGVAFLSRPSSRTIHGDRDARNTHGSARWARRGDIRRAGLLKKHGVVVGGRKGVVTRHPLRDDGLEHVLCLAPTRSGKGVSLIVPTLLTWRESVLVLDIKGENYALSAGYRASIGHRVIRFDPAALSGSAKFNPLAEVRIGTDHEIADCQNIAVMIIDPDGKGLKDFWMQSGWEWLSAAILHVVYRVRKDDGRVATLADVHAFMSVGDGDDIEDDDEGFESLLDDMARFDHGRPSVDTEIRRSAGRMKKRAGSERSGVHSSATVQLALYSDPIVAANISGCDFRIEDLMNDDRPVSLYIVIPPSDIQRLRPLIRILMNQILTRLTAEMTFAGGAPVRGYRHRLLLMLDEFTAIGKLEIFEKALAFMAGYGLKAFIIVHDITQLQKEYGHEESITSNCRIRIAFAPNRIETAKWLSDMTGKTTLVQRKRSRSHAGGKGGGSSVSETVTEVARPLLTADECMSMPSLRKGLFGRTIAGDVLIFAAGTAPIYGRQRLFFQNRRLRARARIEAPAPAPPSANRTRRITPYHTALNPETGGYDE